MAKPFSPRKLVARARAASAPRARRFRAAARCWSSKRAHHRRVGAQVLVSNEEIDLTASEFKLLTTLMSRYPVRCTRSRLVEKVLSYDFEGRAHHRLM